MMEHILNQMRQEALLAMSGRMSVSVGTVSSYDPANYAVRVTLQPDGVDTGWMPIAAMWVGNQYGLFLPPDVGDLVSVYFVDGDIGVGFVGPAFFTVNMRPLSVPAGEAWMVHKTGSLLKFLTDGSISMSAASGKAVNIGSNVAITGKLTTTGDVQAGGNVQDVTGTMATMRTDYNTHTHSDPQGSVTGPPVPLMT